MSIIALDPGQLTLAVLGVAFIIFIVFGFVFGYREDNLIWLITGFTSAGMILLFMSFETWNLTSSLYASLALGMGAIVLITFPVIEALRSMFR